MFTRCPSWAIVWAATATLGLGSIRPAGAQSYSIYDLGPVNQRLEPFETILTFVDHQYGLNNKGQVFVNSRAMSGETHAFLWENGELSDLGKLGGKYSQATAISDRGQVVGFSEASTTSEVPRYAVLWDGVNMTGLPSPSRQWNTIANSYAQDVNNQGQIVGWLSPEDWDGFPDHRAAALWHDGKMLLLDASGSLVSWALGINDRGQVVGSSFHGSEGTVSAFFWENGKLDDLGTLDGFYSSLPLGINHLGRVAGTCVGMDFHLWAGDVFLWESGRMSSLGTGVAFGFNDSGQVVGGRLRGESIRAYLWRKGQPQTDLGTLGGPSSLAFGINSIGRVVGQAITDLGDTHAFYWDGTRGMIDLNDWRPPASGWELIRADFLNDAGEILGVGIHRLQRRVFLLRPATERPLTPEQTGSGSQVIDRLLSDIELSSSQAPKGSLLHLSMTLSAAKGRLISGNSAAAANLLQAFVAQVNALIATGEGLVFPEEAQQWVGSAQAIVTQLQP